MCYSAQAPQSFRRLEKALAATPDVPAYLTLFTAWANGEIGNKIPRAMQDAMASLTGPEATKARELIASVRQSQVSELEAELFKQRKRLADAERALKTKVTKKAQEDSRIAPNNIKRAKARLDDLNRDHAKPKDNRIFPGSYSSVLLQIGGERVLLPMRYQCRPAGKPASYDKRYPGTYNARRDNLEGFWKGQFGHNHGLMLVDTFYEFVEGPDGKSVELAFTPQDSEPMYVACLWSHWQDPKGVEPDLLSFAAITDEPEPEVAAAGHDRTVINIKPEHIDAWLNPEPDRLAAMYEIFDDKQHPFYEHRVAA